MKNTVLPTRVMHTSIYKESKCKTISTFEHTHGAKLALKDEAMKPVNAAL